MPVKTITIVKVSIFVIISLSHTQAIIELKSGDAFVIMKHTLKGIYSICNTKHKKAIAPLMHLVSKMNRFFGVI